METGAGRCVTARDGCIWGKADAGFRANIAPRCTALAASLSGRYPV
jgi:hypothetical protein